MRHSSHHAGKDGHMGHAHHMKLAHHHMKEAVKAAKRAHHRGAKKK